MDKSNQVWYRFKNNLEQFNIDCVDLLSKPYMMLGQRPDTSQIVMMSKFLIEDLSRNHGSMTLDEVAFAFEQGIKHSEHGGFINVRTMSQFIKEYKKNAQAKRQQQLLTDYEKEQQNLKFIGQSINKAKRLK